MNSTNRYSDSELKYTLRIYVNTLLQGKSERYLARKLKISWTTYQKDKFALKSDSFSMPEYRLQKYAKALDLSIAQILNYEVNQECLIDSQNEHIEPKGDRLGRYWVKSYWGLRK